MKFFNVFLSLACILVLLSCGGCVSLTGSPSDPHIHAARYSDASIKTNIGSSLLNEDASKANDINVHCFNGHVFLVGEADKAFRATALAIAQKTTGVVNVTPHWFPSGTADTVEDASIEADIDLKFLFAKGEGQSAVDLDVWGGHVVLTGLAAKQADIDRATTAIKKIDHVKSVTSYVLVSSK